MLVVLHSPSTIPSAPVATANAAGGSDSMAKIMSAFRATSAGVAATCIARQGKAGQVVEALCQHSYYPVCGNIRAKRLVWLEYSSGPSA